MLAWGFGLISMFFLLHKVLRACSLTAEPLIPAPRHHQRRGWTILSDKEKEWEDSRLLEAKDPTADPRKQEEKEWLNRAPQVILTTTLYKTRFGREIEAMKISTLKQDQKENELKIPAP